MSDVPPFATKLVAYDEINKEAFMSLHVGHFTGLSMNDSTSFLDRKFYLSLMMLEKPVYQVGGYYFTTNLVMLGKASSDGSVAAKLRASISDHFLVKANAVLRFDPCVLTGLVTFDHMGLRHRAQLQLGSKGVLGATYVHRCTPSLSLGTEFVCSNLAHDPAVGFALRFEDDKTVATAKGSSTGSLLITYLHKVSKKVFLATDFVYNIFSKDVKASVGCDYMFDQCRVIGRIDSDGVACASLEEGVNSGLKFLVSASWDQSRGLWKVVNFSSADEFE
ncbi:PREDICTED: mitochondrial import receptor subunit TOM40-1-like isoform X1 [Camelina sativa]|uniref:Mitochondrial import receptor subunit TOM40-1-like isoform X1 n=1 Tax=Camelina sativa TaxID=90675 RepID=A0ABM0WXM3_CAMSA|nr:PREDICTED: mitochondrial import receptor subunit TOM40-1-like isoform X1 [Camelina sativa]XP_019094251.1 PREDICTED: mitochondrial import receptor subunit TOM40-1-like isoform X1 [Camelina sativa]XP_019094252.1 PREDICTED: mitochondrial import receptor subunit TOM40-1-like isoform X1 [Camelina sativa]XP_019094253.1 PREDICTED: mitochondrial import receptor subunit TOM40-1-like isoform X1 [Camelina sativa]